MGYMESGAGFTQGPSQSGYATRSGGMTQSYRSQSGMPTMSHGPASAQPWAPSGNVIQIDEAELAELNRMVEDLQGRLGAAEARAQQLGSITEADVLKFIIKNSLTARGDVKDMKGGKKRMELTLENTVCSTW